MSLWQNLSNTFVQFFSYKKGVYKLQSQENQYLELLSKLLVSEERKDRTGVGTKSIFGYQMRFDLSKGFPLLTTKKVHFHSVVTELLWFLRGDTNIQYLEKNGVRIWRDWRYQEFKKFYPEVSLDPKGFSELIVESNLFADLFGDIGKGYGHQWRNFGATKDCTGVDQITQVIQEIKTNPNSRRLVVSSWNPAEIFEADLPPCHTLFQFYVQDGKLSCQLYQRSADVFLGVPFNIASYALLTHIVALECGLEVGEFVWTGGDVHLYSNHVNQAKEQISRTPFEFPQLEITRCLNFWEYEPEDFEVINYKHHPAIKGDVAV